MPNSTNSSNNLDLKELYKEMIIRLIFLTIGIFLIDFLGTVYSNSQHQLEAMFGLKPALYLLMIGLVILFSLYKYRQFHDHSYFKNILLLDLLLILSSIFIIYYLLKTPEKFLAYIYYSLIFYIIATFGGSFMTIAFEFFNILKRKFNNFLINLVGFRPQQSDRSIQDMVDCLRSDGYSVEKKI
jgi:hypothetical protein